MFYLFNTCLASSLQCCQCQVLHLLAAYGGYKVEVVGGIKSIIKVLTNPDQIFFGWLAEVYSRHIWYFPTLAVQKPAQTEGRQH